LVFYILSMDVAASFYEGAGRFMLAHEKAAEVAE
jgi:hypothetical protein